MAELRSSSGTSGLSGLMNRLIALVLLDIITKSRAPYTDVYNFPMFGVLMFDAGQQAAYGSVTIAHAQLALCAAENILQLDPSGTEFITNPLRAPSLYVVAGTDLLHPPKTWYEPNKVKRVKIKDIYLGRHTGFANLVDEKALKDVAKFVSKHKSGAAKPPEHIPGSNAEAQLKNKGWLFNPFHELRWDVAILILEAPLQWSPYILPLPVFLWGTSAELTRAYRDAWNTIEAVERIPHDYVPCSVPGWSPMGNNEIIYHRVVYIRFKECAEALCGKYPSTCLNYLNSRHHVCFKSLNFADSCIIDQGAPVLCSWYPNKVVGILTRAFDCGADLLPSVFTRLDSIALFAAVAQLPTSYSKKEPQLDDPNYTENPNI